MSKVVLSRYGEGDQANKINAWHDDVFVRVCDPVPGMTYQMDMASRTGKTTLLCRIGMRLSHLGYDVRFMCVGNAAAFVKNGFKRFDSEEVTPRTVLLRDDQERLKYWPNDLVTKTGGIVIETSSGGFHGKVVEPNVIRFGPLVHEEN
jgi:hypothetical protein